MNAARVPGRQRDTGLRHWAGLVAAWLVMLTMGAFLTLALVLPRLGGGTPYVIETGSMSPALPPGTLVVVRPAPSSEILVGDVITYQVSTGDPTVVTHRVVARGMDVTGQPRWRTRGDANDDVDAGWVLPVQLKGERWYAVPYLGHVTSFITDQQRTAITLLLVVGLLGYALVQARAALRQRRFRAVLTLNPSTPTSPSTAASAQAAGTDASTAAPFGSTGSTRMDAQA